MRSNEETPLDAVFHNLIRIRLNPSGYNLFMSPRRLDILKSFAKQRRNALLCSRSGFLEIGSHEHIIIQEVQ